MAGQKVACPTCGSQTILRSPEPPRIKIPVQRLPTASHREEGMAGIAPVSRKILDNVEKVVIGKRQEIVLALVAFFSEGHLLLEDVPGVAKTMLARAIAQSVGCSFKRIQCTPDLLPNDITGASVFNPKTTEFEFRRGPLFAHIVLADEINRTTPAHPIRAPGGDVGTAGHRGRHDLPAATAVLPDRDAEPGGS